jgi:hypothetical protein
MKTHWQRYKELEILPDFIPDPSIEAGTFMYPLREAWRILLNVLADELVYEQQIEFLERCLAQDLLEFYTDKKSWKKFLKLID